MNNPTFHLEGIVKSKGEQQDFEGPLNLILMLLSKNKIEIRDIQISEILDQYIEHITKMQELDLDVASEFVQMASHLVYIKTKMLLKSDEEEITELELLISSLEQLKCKDIYNAVKEITPALAKASERGLLLGTKPPEPLPTARKYNYSHEPIDLLKAFSLMFSRKGSLPELQVDTIAPKRIIYGVKDKSRELIVLLQSSGPKTLRAMYDMCSSRSEIVATFISVLELCSMGSLKVEAGAGGFLISFAGGDTEEILEAIIE